MSVKKTVYRLPSLAVGLLLCTACGLTNPFQTYEAPADAGPESFSAPLMVSLDSPSPTEDPNVRLTITWCGRISSVLVTEGEVPAADDARWAPCVTDPGALTYELTPGGGAHFLRVWGKDSAGRLTESPTQVAVVSGDSMFALGDSHSCVLIAGTVKCWGDNTWGQLGDGSSAGVSATPVVPTGLESGVQMIVSGPHGRSTCALRDGQVWCWGSNAKGQLGNNSPTSRCTDGTTTVSCSQGPVPVVDGLATPLQDVVSLQGGFDFYCARLADESVRCWGANQLGQLGDNQASGASKATPVTPTLSQGVQWLTSGYATSCALLKDGSSVSCWGQDYAIYDGYGPSSALIGGSGDATSGSLRIARKPRPTQALDLATLPEALVLGYYHGCTLTAGEVKCWGLNKEGQIGNGLRTNTTTAVPIPLPASADLIVSGAHHACARLTDGTVACWGMNEVGQLGLVSSETGADLATCSRVPLTVAGLGHVAGLGAGRWQTCATTDQGVSCWGADTTSMLQGAASEMCIPTPDEPETPCSHAPLLMVGL